MSSFSDNSEGMNSVLHEIDDESSFSDNGR